MELKYERWATARLINKARCLVEKSMTCIPLRGDPICRACYEESKRQCIRPGRVRRTARLAGAAA